MEAGVENPRHPHTASDSPPEEVPDHDYLRITSGIAAGEEKAFQCFYDIFSRRLFRLCLWLAQGDEGMAGELFQQTMIKAARKLKPMERGANIWAWLATVAKNTHLDVLKKGGVVILPLDSLPAEAASIQGQDHEGDLLQSLNQALQELPEEDRRLLEARYFDEKSYEELCSEFSASYKSIDSRLTRLRKKLRQIMLGYLRHET